MKAKFLKIAGVKNEKQFYAKYPTEAAFFKAHPEAKELKKAQAGFGNLLPVGNAISSALNKNTSGNLFQNPFSKGNIGGTINMLPGIIGGIQGIGAAKKQTADAETMAKVSDIQLQAARTTPEPIRRKLNRPEMYAARPDELFPSQGTGYDAGFAAKHGTTLKAEDGMQIGGNLTEIQNMYNPGDIYSNLGYEPLSESDVVKQYADGGIVPIAQQGFNIGQIGSSVFGSLMGSSPESDLFGKIGSLGGPAFGVLGTITGKILGAGREGREANALAKLKANTNQMMGIQQGQGIQSQFSSYMEDGGTIPYAEEGWVSHDWQPQLITKWGDVNVEDVDDIFRPADMRTLEHGGPVKAQGGMNLPYPNYEERVNRFRNIMGKYSEEELNRRATTEAGLAEYAKLYPNEPFTLEDISFFQDYTTKVLDPQTQAFMQRRGADWKPGTQRSKTDAIWGPKTQKQPFANVLLQTSPGSSEFKDLGTVREGYATSGTDGSGAGSMKGLVPSKITFPGGKAVNIEFIDGADGKKPYFRNPSTGDMAPYDPSKYHADTGRYYRTGGSIRQNYLSELDNFNFGGNLKTHWGGRAEVDSYNPYLPGTGETVMFKGNQHSESDGTGKTGIGVSYGPKEHDSYTDYAEYGTEQAADVEVENGEPAAQLPDETGDLSMTVFGAIKINKDAARQIGDPDAEGLTYKNLVKGYNKKENKLNKKLDKANEELANLQVNTPFDRLKFNSLQSTIQGSDQELRRIAALKMNAAGVQNDQNEIADKYGLDVNALAKGQIKPSKDMDNAKYGTKKAQRGTITGSPRLDSIVTSTGVFPPAIIESEYTSSAGSDSKKPSSSSKKKTTSSGSKKKPSGKKTSTTAKFEVPKTPLILQSAQNAAVDPKDPLGLKKILPIKEESYVMPPYSRESFEAGLQDVAKGFKDYRERKAIDAGLKTANAKSEPKSSKSKTEGKSKKDIEELAKILASQLPAMLRRPYDEAFDYQQTLPERAALAMNQLEPVDVQLLKPLLTQPFQVSLEDQKAQIKSSYANARRLTGNNPAAQAMIAAKEAEDLNKINAEEFRMNQGIMAESFNKNRELLNAYQQANAAALDKQYERQAGAKSKTKATYLEALKSIVDKEVKHKADIRTLAAYSNLFPQYGFDRNMMAVSQLPTFFQKGIVGSTQEAEGKENKKESTGKYGLKKQLKNGSIVKSLKNI